MSDWQAGGRLILLLAPPNCHTHAKKSSSNSSGCFGSLHLSGIYKNCLGTQLFKGFRRGTNQPCSVLNWCKVLSCGKKKKKKMTIPGKTLELRMKGTIIYFEVLMFLKAKWSCKNSLRFLMFSVSRSMEPTVDIFSGFPPSLCSARCKMWLTKSKCPPKSPHVLLPLPPQHDAQ